MILRDIKEVLPNGDLKEWDNLNTDTMVIQAYEYGRLEEERSAHDMELMPLNIDYIAYCYADEFTKESVMAQHDINELSELHQKFNEKERHEN